MKVKDVLSAYRRSAEATGKHSPRARYNHYKTLELFGLEFGEADHADLEPFQVEDWVLAQDGSPGKANWRSNATRRHRLAVVKAPFRWARKGGRIDRNPFDGSGCPFGDVKRDEMPDAVLEQLCRAANKRFERVLRFLRFTGAREGEVCRALWPDVDLEVGSWVIPLHKGVKFTQRPRVAGLSGGAVELLRQIRLEAVGAVSVAEAGAAVAAGVQPVLAGEGHVFLNTRGRPWIESSLRHALGYVRDRLGIRCGGLHTIRHRALTAMGEAGVSLALIGEQAGQRDPRSTKRYLHLADKVDALRAAAEAGEPGRQDRRRPPAIGA